jgi:nucleoside-diphosphate-sugar epimerase
MKILITGGRGFIGAKVVELLCQEHSVTVLDNNENYGLITSKELDRLYSWRERKWGKVNFIHGNVRDRMVGLKAFKNNPDLVIHLASYPRAKIVNQDPISGVSQIVDGTTNMLWHAKTFRAKKFVYISSSMVYGNFTKKINEEADTKPINIYGEAKLTGERLVKLFCKDSEMNYAIVRPSGVYGPGDLPDRVVSKFFEAAMANNPLKVHNGENKVDFTYRGDAAQGIVDVALSDVKNTSFNITYGNAITLQQAAEEIIKITGSKSKIIDTGRNTLYPDRGTLDISRAKQLVGYNPKFSFAEGLVSTYRWLKNHYGN